MSKNSPASAHNNTNRYLPKADLAKPPAIIIHGGPGLEHTYLYEWLKPLSQYRELFFYDQLGCGNDKTPAKEVTTSSLIEQLASKISQFSKTQQISIIAHSWGAYLALSALHNPTLNNRIKELVLISPIPLTGARNRASTGQLLSRLPKEILTKYEKIAFNHSESNQKAGLKIMQLLLPYYLSPSSRQKPPDITFKSYNLALDEQITNSLGEYDLRTPKLNLPDKTLTIYGEDDFETPLGTKELQKPPTVLKIIPKAGHFPFAEKPTEFKKIMAEFFES